MRVFFPGAEGREYSSALSLETKEAPAPYDKVPTPVLIVRQRGEAWDRPFAAIYEPRSTATTGSADGIQSAAALTSAGRFAGFKITSRLAGRTLTQLVLVSAAADREFSDPALGLAFRGRYAVVTLDERDTVAALYLGEGMSLHFRGYTLTTPSAAFADFGGATPTLTASTAATLQLPNGSRISAAAPARR